MIKSNLEKNIISNNIPSFKNHIRKAPISILIKLLPFICACGSLLMLKLLDSKLDIKNINIESNNVKEHCMRMGLLTENFPIVEYLYDKNCMDESKILRYYLYSGGSNIDIFNLLDKNKYWDYVTENDIIYSIKNGNLDTIKFLQSKNLIPLYNYTNLNVEKQTLLLQNNDLFNYYISNNYNLDIILNELYIRKQKNIKFFNSILILKRFFYKIRNQIK
jgi:hypothetical protein